ncbi:TonB-dependent receptor [Paucibacter sp. R3-3]|uniref:TonB-dependent receptor n=1 Tax=Roseateles agri TaxID=3098619 RepID=A0ABU5DFS5_9BURK|nr:TonB-dependent receptor [Paucibacter sp. R3-3]MDY0745135.1 TonB-dependent receptor [Paucibacter sp. R3-3]
MNEPTLTPSADRIANACGGSRQRSRQPLPLTRCALAASLAIVQMSAARAQQAEAAPAPAAPASAAARDTTADQLDRVIVTGSTSLKRTVRESSVAVTVADREDLDRKAPRSTASALELIPGFMVEDSGGEVSNNFSVRGLAGGGQTFVQLSEDGLPVFYTNALADTILKQELMIDRMEAVRGGTSGILTVNGAGATVNFLTFRNKDEREGAIRLTTSDYATRRLDLRYGGDLGGGWYGGGGGFYRGADSPRDVGFTADHGGIVRGYLGKKLDNGGDFSVNVKLVNDHNTFLLPIPVQGLGDPKSIPGFNANTGTMLGPDNAMMTVRTSAATGALSQLNDARNQGVYTRAVAIGYNYEQPLSPQWTVRSKGRYTDFKNDFNAVFSYDNASLVSATDRLNPAKWSDVQGMLNRFAAACGGSCTPALKVTSTGQIIKDASALSSLNGNGLVAGNISADNKRYVREFVNDASATWTTSNNSLTAGWLAFDTHIDKDQNVGATSFLSDVRSNARRLDIVALDAQGNVKGYLTDNSVLQYEAWGEGVNNSHATSNSIYLNDEFKASDRWRLDGGVRFEHYSITARHGIGASDTTIPGAFDSNGTDVDNVMANNNFGGAFSGNFNTIRSSFNEKSLTFGSNYLINDYLAAYGRYSSSYQANGENPVTKISFAEAGIRMKAKGFSGSLTYFRTKYKDARISRQFGTDTTDTAIQGDYNVDGIEVDALWRPVRWAGLNVVGSVQDAKFTGHSVTGPSATTAISGPTAFDGNRPERTPKINYTMSPTFYLPDGKGELSISYHRVGQRFADPGNTIVLPAYGTWNLSGRYELTPTLSLLASIQNLTNTVGLTEGNPRSGFSESSGSNYYFARPILGRNANVSLTLSF